MNLFGGGAGIPVQLIKLPLLAFEVFTPASPSRGWHQQKSVSSKGTDEGSVRKIFFLIPAGEVL